MEDQLDKTQLLHGPICFGILKEAADQPTDPHLRAVRRDGSSCIATWIDTVVTIATLSSTHRALERCLLNAAAEFDTRPAFQLGMNRVARQTSSDGNDDLDDDSETMKRTETLL